MSDTFDEKIAQKEQELGNVKASMEGIRHDFLNACNSFYKEWYETEVKRAIEGMPERTKQLGVGGLKPLKGALNKCIEAIPQTIKRNLDQEEVWLHRKQSIDIRKVDERGYSISHERAEEPIRAALREGLSCIGQVLHEFGFVKPERYGWEVQSGRVRWSIGFNQTSEMDKLMRLYNEQGEKLRSVCEQLAELKKQKEGAEARSLWYKA